MRDLVEVPEPGPAPESRFPRLSGTLPMVGREAECHRVEELLGGARSRAIVISGAMGVGRTRLLREAVDLARAGGWDTLELAGFGAATDVPLAALAHIVPAADGTERPDPFTLLQRGLRSLREWGGRPMVCVDDAHLLDELSLTVLHQLVLTGTGSVLATTRSDRGHARLVLAHWGDDVDGIELGPLDQPAADAMLTSLLDEAVEARTAQRLWQLTRGIPLYLREVVRAGRDSGRLRFSGGVWRWEGELVASRRLAELVHVELDLPRGAAEHALELLATAGCAHIDRLLELVGSETVADLERRGLISEDRDGRVGLAHPLHAMVLRTRVSGAVRALARGLQPADPAADDRASPERAASANRELDHERAEQLARRCLTDDPDGRAHLELIEALRWQDRTDEIGPLLDPTQQLVRSPHGRTRLALSRALLARRTARSAVLRDERSMLSGGAAEAGAEEGLVAVETALAHLGGHPSRVPARGHVGPAGSWEALRLAALAGATAAAGRIGEALGHVADARAELHRVPQPAEATLAGLMAVDAELLAFATAGRFDELEQVADAAHRSNMAAPDWAGDALVAFYCGRAARGRGRLETAARRLGEALTGLERRDPLAQATRCAGELAQVRALLGDPQGAADVLDGPGERRATGHDDPAVALARAWIRAGTGQTGEAVQELLEVAAAAAERGDYSAEADLLHVVTRFGRPAAARDRLRELARQMEGRLVGLHAEAARAAAAGSGADLDTVATEYEELGAWVQAADTAAVAAAAHRSGGDRRRASASAATAARLAESCDGVDTPALSRIALPRLTTREAEVARLAARGTSNADIADALVVSVRTVETHLAHAYAKLGISTRDALARALPGTELPASP